MQGCGNDYIYFDCFEQEIKEPSELAVRLSDRHFGVGGDGIILICPSDKADCKMRMFNLDGSEGNMCGNGIRCVGRYIYEKRNIRKDKLTIETKSGIKTLSVNTENGEVVSLTVNMGAPEFETDKIPVTSEKKEMVGESLTVGDFEYKVTCVSMGNPHCVIFCDETEGLDVCGIGNAIGSCGIFPEGVNVEFISVTADGRLKMRVCERGSGETLACGTGACAAVSAAVKLGRVPKNKTVKVELLGGELDIALTDGGVMMTGGAEYTFEGEVDV